MRVAKLFIIGSLCMTGRAQSPDPHAGHDMSGHQHPQEPEKKKADEPPMDHSMNNGMKMNMDGSNAAGDFLMMQSSGTSMNPESWRMPMFMPRLGSWSTMLMGQLFLVETQQSGPRGGDKLYSANWFMAAAEHSVGQGSFMAETMISLDPATVTHRSYPLLFQTGETAFGKPLVDAQHPHDLIMSLGVHYAHPFGDGGMVQVFYGPVGDPALGPVAFPHRASASEIPQAALGHHWQDSTHIADNVVTVGVKYQKVRLEASGFYGSEPNENRWNIDWGPMNSWSTRLSVFPTKNWMAQVSVGRLSRPERQEPGDVVRATASLHYSRNGWSSSLIWGRNHSTETGRNLNSYLAETVIPWKEKNFFTGRMELTDKDELFSNNLALQDILDRKFGSTFRIGSYTAGYTRDVDLVRGLETGIGMNVSAYTLPSAIQPYYGGHPVGVNVFLRVRLKPAS